MFRGSSHFVTLEKHDKTAIRQNIMDFILIYRLTKKIKDPCPEWTKFCDKDENL